MTNCYVDLMSKEVVNKGWQKIVKCKIGKIDAKVIHIYFEKAVKCNDVFFTISNFFEAPF